MFSKYVKLKYVFEICKTEICFQICKTRIEYSTQTCAPVSKHRNCNVVLKTYKEERQN